MTYLKLLLQLLALKVQYKALSVSVGDRVAEITQMAQFMQEYKYKATRKVSTLSH